MKTSKTPKSCKRLAIIKYVNEHNEKINQHKVEGTEKKKNITS